MPSHHSRDHNPIKHSKEEHMTTTTRDKTTHTEYVTDDGDGWQYHSDRYGDTQGLNATRGLRTRLKRATGGSEPRSGLDHARHDVATGRLQTRRGDVWVDKIRNEV